MSDRRPGSKLVIEVTDDGAEFAMWLEPFPSRVPRTAEKFKTAELLWKRLASVLPALKAEIK